MSHSEHSSNEKKPVAFTVPFILASVTVVVILMFLSLCDPKANHGKCECKEDCSKECMEACENGDHTKHPQHENQGKHEEHQHHGAAAETAAPANDSLAKPASEPAPAH